jgi:hypothetical protein
LNKEETKCNQKQLQSRIWKVILLDKNSVRSKTNLIGPDQTGSFQRLLVKNTNNGAGHFNAVVEEHRQQWGSPRMGDFQLANTDEIFDSWCDLTLFSGS